MAFAFPLQAAPPPSMPGAPPRAFSAFSQPDAGGGGGSAFQLRQPTPSFAPPPPSVPLGATAPPPAPSRFASMFSSNSGRDASVAAPPLKQSCTSTEDSITDASSNNIVEGVKPRRVFSELPPVTPPPLLPPIAVAAPPTPSPFNPLQSSGAGRGRGMGRGGARGGLLDGSGSRNPSSVRPSSSQMHPQQSTSSYSHPMSRLFQNFIQHVMDVEDAIKREGSTETILTKAFFELEWRSAPPEALQEMISIVRQQQKAVQMKTKLERWAVVFFLGCNINCLTRAVFEDRVPDCSSGEYPTNNDHNTEITWQSIFRAALERANVLCETFQELFMDSRRCASEAVAGGGSPQAAAQEQVIPQSAIRCILRRVRVTFEQAALAGVHDITSQEAQLISAIVRRDTPSALFRCLTECPRTRMECITAKSTAALMSEMCVIKITTELGRLLEYATSFHTYCAQSEPLMRCTLYYRVALLILQALPLTSDHIHEARQLLAHAVVLCPPNHSNGVHIAKFFAATSLALGFVVDEEWLDSYEGLGPLFGSMCTALRTADGALYEATLARLLPAYVEGGVAALMQHMRAFVRVAMVLGYYLALGNPMRLEIQGLVDYYGVGAFPPHVVEENEATGDDGDVKVMTATASTSTTGMMTTVHQNVAKSWLVPLLMERYINGTIDGGSLILSRQRPFEVYPEITGETTAG